MSGKHILLPHKFPKNYAEFLASLSLKERNLQELAAKNLGSSYFMEKTTAYKKWLANNK